MPNLFEPPGGNGYDLPAGDPAPPLTDKNNPSHDCPKGSTWKNGPQGPGCYIQECPPGGIPGDPSCPPPPPDKDTTNPETPPSTDCPPGTHWNNNAKQCRPGAAATGSGATGGGGGGGASAFRGTTAAAPIVGGAVEDQIYQHVLDLLSGKEDPYSDERLGRLKASLFSTTQGRARSEQDQLDEDLISSGMFRSGDRVKGRATIRRGASKDYTTGVAGFLNEQEKARYQARLDALDRAQKWLDSKRQYLLATEDNQIKLKIGLAQIQLGYAKIASEEKQLEQTLAARGGGGGGGTSDEDLLRQIIYG